MLGDLIETALDTVGVTQQRVSKWLGKPCRCPEYRDKLNQLDSWARRIAVGKVAKAKHYIEEILAQ